MRWITEILGGENAKPVWEAIGNALKYLFADIRGVLMCCFFGWAMYENHTGNVFVGIVKDKYVTPSENARNMAIIEKQARQIDTLTHAASIQNKLFNDQLLTTQNIIHSKDSTIQQKDFIIRNYEVILKQTIKN